MKSGIAYNASATDMHIYNGLNSFIIFYHDQICVVYQYMVQSMWFQNLSHQQATKALTSIYISYNIDNIII